MLLPVSRGSRRGARVVREERCGERDGRASAPSDYLS